MTKTFELHFKAEDKTALAEALRSSFSIEDGVKAEVLLVDKSPHTKGLDPHLVDVVMYIVVEWGQDIAQDMAKGAIAGLLLKKVKHYWEEYKIKKVAIKDQSDPERPLRKINPATEEEVLEEWMRKGKEHEQKQGNN
ncbi:MAG: hypothetical protein JNN12_00900 [Bacteroidetes Order II. Incertae sedis bacterium]|nr:hypothetical protein [Bacteroidetes Order II. bacterium]